MDMVGVSSGTAEVLGLKKIKANTSPTTAYLLLGNGCRNACSFCPQGQRGGGKKNYLSRITWPEFRWEEVLIPLFEKYKQGLIKRVCFQVTDYPNSLTNLIKFSQPLVNAGIPVNASCAISDTEQAARVLDVGLDRLTIALDAVTPELGVKIKGNRWKDIWRLLFSLAQKHPGRVGTHLIAGLGEKERDMVRALWILIKQRIAVGLFAFTPIRGTPLSHKKPPHLDYYRKIQVVRHLFREKKINFNDLTFDTRGSLIDWGLPGEELFSLIHPDYFLTPGCKDCNRPYYNERPGKEMYNFPRYLTEEEFLEAKKEIVKNTKQEADLDGKACLETTN